MIERHRSLSATMKVCIMSVPKLANTGAKS